MRKIIICSCILFAALSLKAQSINGICINGGNSPILVYLEGTQMCTPTTTCFVANLSPGYYTVEVYATRFTRPGERIRKREKLYNERIYFKGNGVQDILLEGRGNVHRPGPGQGEQLSIDMAMNDQLFGMFLDSVKDAPLEEDRMNVINTVLGRSYFTSEQCLKLVRLYSFDHERLKIMRMMYPRIVDKEAFFTVIGVLSFSNSRENMNDFIREYEER